VGKVMSLAPSKIHHRVHRENREKYSKNERKRDFYPSDAIC
jgi:hypothetical protein